MSEMVAERLDRLEKMLDKLCFALQRKETEQSGNWGWPSFYEELIEIREKMNGAKDETL
jgi:hypothetical protein